MNNPVLIDVTVSSISGWVRLSEASLIADVTLLPTNSTIRIRADGGSEVLFSSATVPFRIEGVDLSRFEVSSTSGVPVRVIVVGNTRGG